MLSTEGVLYKTEPDSALENFDFNLEKIEMPHSVKIRSFEAAFAGQHIFCVDDQSTARCLNVNLSKNGAIIPSVDEF